MAESDAIIEFEDRRKQSLTEWVGNVEAECHRGHRSLRADFRTYIDENAETLELMRDATTALRGRVDLIERTPQDAMKLRFSTPVVVGLLMATFSIAGTGYGVGSMVMGRIDALSNRVDQAAEASKTDRETSTKLQDERAARLATDIAAIKAQQTMQDLRLTNLREMLIGKAK